MKILTKPLKSVKKGEYFHVGLNRRIIYTKPFNGVNPITAPAGRVHCVGFILIPGRTLPTVVTLCHFAEEALVQIISPDVVNPTSSSGDRPHAHSEEIVAPGHT